MSKVTWLRYQFEVLRQSATWNTVGGVYIFAGVNPQNQWVALYIGQTDSFRNRIPQHERWNEAVRQGATHVHALVVEQAASREQIEAELIAWCNPPLNVQLR